MARFLSQHSLACLTRQGAEELAERLFRSTAPATRRVLANLHEGKMLVEFDAGSREELEAWLHSQRFHFDWILRLELESDRGHLHPV